MPAVPAMPDVFAPLRRDLLRIAGTTILLAAAAFAGCATVAAPPPPRATLVITCPVPDASVWVDDRYAGPVSAWAKGSRVLAGFRRIEVRHPDHFSFFAEVTPKDGETVRIAPTLRRLLD